MYKSFFGLKKNPFNVNPDPSYLYLTPQTGRTLDELTYGIESRKGLMLLTGEAGTGKTTLINHLLLWLEHKRAHSAFIFNSHLDSEQLFDFIFSEFEIPVTSQAKANPLLAFNEWLLARYRARDLVVLIVDEGQGLPIHVLEEIRLLSNMELPNEKLLQIVLVGQPELEAKLRRPDLRQLQQRIGLRCRTAPLTLEEVAGYIGNRLHTAGSNSELAFEQEAVESVHNYSGGIPRVINLLCENALINAYVEHTKVVSAAMVAEAARELQFDTFRPVAPPRLRTIAAPTEVSDLHAILAKIKADADAWEDKPKATPYLVSAHKSVINHQGDAFSAGESETLDTKLSSPVTSREPHPHSRERVWKREPGGKNAARARRAIGNLRSSLELAFLTIRKYGLEGKLTLCTEFIRVHGIQTVVRSIRNLELQTRVKRNAKRVRVHGIDPAMRSLRKLELNRRFESCGDIVRNVVGPRLARFSQNFASGMRTCVDAARNGAAPFVDSMRCWFGHNFNERSYGKTLIASLVACGLLIEIFLQMDMAHASQHPGWTILCCLGILWCAACLIAGVSILVRARLKLKADAGEVLAKVSRWLRGPITPVQTRAKLGGGQDPYA